MRTVNQKLYLALALPLVDIEAKGQQHRIWQLLAVAKPHAIDRLAVVDGNTLTGIITRQDIVWAISGTGKRGET